MTWSRKHLTDKLVIINDAKMQHLRESWFAQPQKQCSYETFKRKAIDWFQDTKVNDLKGWKNLPYVDVTMGCTHYIESFVLKYGWGGFQILKNEYAYYTLMGKHGVEIDALEKNKPMIITMPHWQYCDIRPEWDDLLKICEQKNIDIHIDMAWMIIARDINLNFSHPCIKSIGMSMSKYALQWNRVGIRLSRQKTMDSVTIFNDYYRDTNTIMTSIGSYWMDNLERDYVWNRYGNDHDEICAQLDLSPTKIIHVVKDKNTGKSLGIGRMLGESTPYSI